MGARLGLCWTRCMRLLYVSFLTFQNKSTAAAVPLIKYSVQVTYLSHVVGATQTLSLPFISPGLEQVLEHCWLSSL